MESTDLKDVEQDRLEDLMRYIRQSLEKRRRFLDSPGHSIRNATD